MSTLKKSMVTTANKIFLDANVVIEMALSRPRSEDIKSILRSHPHKACISALTVHLLVYFASKSHPLDKIEKLLTSFDILDVRSEDTTWAFKYIEGLDFEDALQVAVAVRHGCDEFITLDKKLSSKYQQLPKLRLIKI